MCADFVGGFGRGTRKVVRGVSVRDFHFEYLVELNNFFVVYVIVK